MIKFKFAYLTSKQNPAFPVHIACYQKDMIYAIDCMSLCGCDQVKVSALRD